MQKATRFGSNKRACLSLAAGAFDCNDTRMLYMRDDSRWIDLPPGLAPP